MGLQYGTQAYQASGLFSLSSGHLLVNLNLCLQQNLAGTLLH